VQYIDVSHGVGVPEKMKRGLRAGAYLTGKPAVKKGSAAANAGLLEGDILLTVNGINIGEARGLDELISQMKVGEEITLTLDRAGEKKTQKVVLGEFAK
jgi:S1-C subfamily serine protease